MTDPEPPQRAPAHSDASRPATAPTRWSLTPLDDHPPALVNGGQPVGAVQGAMRRPTTDSHPRS